MHDGEKSEYWQGPHYMAWQAGLWPAGRLLHTPEVGKTSPKDFWGSCSFSGTGSLKPIEAMTHSDKCTGEIERKAITDMRRAFPESEGDLQEAQIICVRLV